MKKVILRFLGVLFLVGGIVISLMAGAIKESNRPATVTYGTITNGNFAPIGSGEIGGSRKNMEEMRSLQGIGIMICVIGGGLVAGSFLSKEN